MSSSEIKHHPKRVLSSGFTLAVTIGGIVGLGILRTPGEVASVAPNPLLFVSLWVMGGIFALLSTVVAAEESSGVNGEAITVALGGSYSRNLRRSISGSGRFSASRALNASWVSLKPH
jgi:hypothetical protein